MRQGSLPRQGDHFYKSIAGKSYCPNDAAFGSKADIQRPRKHVRFTPKSRHVQCTGPCLLWAKSGHAHHSITSSAKREQIVRNPKRLRVPAWVQGVNPKSAYVARIARAKTSAENLDAKSSRPWLGRRASAARCVPLKKLFSCLPPEVFRVCSNQRNTAAVTNEIPP